MTGQLINIVKGADFAFAVQLLDTEGAVINLSGFSGISTIKQDAGAQSVLGYFDFAIQSETEGIISLSLDSTGTDALPVTQAVYDVDLYSPSGYASKVLWGYADIYPSTGPIESTNGTGVVITNPIAAQPLFLEVAAPSSGTLPITASLTEIPVYGQTGILLGQPAGFATLIVDGQPRKIAYY